MKQHQSEFNPSEYINGYIKENYDRLNIQIPLGQKAILKEFCKSRGCSLNALVNNAIWFYMDFVEREEKAREAKDNKKA